MKDMIVLAAFLLPVALTAQSIDPQAKPQPGVRFELRPGPLVPGPVPLDKEPGDDITIRPDGAIVATSRSRSFVFPLTNRMEPVLRVSYRIVNNRVLYDYTLSNGASAAEPISSFMLGIAGEAEVTVPEPWKAIRVKRPFEPPSFGIGRALPDSEFFKGLLTAGASLTPIRVLCDDAPGLIEATYYPSPVKEPLGEMKDGEFINSASPWVQRRLTELDTADRHHLRGLAIGPVTPLNADSIEVIRKEIQTASQRPQLAALQLQIRNQPFPEEKTGLSRWLADARKQASPGILSEFLDAMIWRLVRLP